MNIEIWTSNKGQQEIHHFVEGKQNTYLFGINKQLLGDACYDSVIHLIQERLVEIEEKSNS